MGYVLGTDEAGYGPNLGPLVVTATLWEVPDDSQEDNLTVRRHTVERSGTGPLSSCQTITTFSMATCGARAKRRSH